MTEGGLAGIVGADNVSEDAAVLAAFCGDESLADRIMPRWVVRPRKAGDVAAIIRWANETSTPLVPVSSGPPHFRGGAVPERREAVMVDMRGMNRILRVDAKNRITMVEAGVSFGTLVPALEKEGLRLNLPLLPRSSKSVIGSLLEREPVVCPSASGTPSIPWRVSRLSSAPGMFSVPVRPQDPGPWRRSGRVGRPR